MAGEVFISYRRSDQAKAELLHRLLTERGVDSWYDALLGAGEDWRTKTAEALVKAPIFVLLFSKNAAQSDDIIKELSAATFQKKTVIPVRIEDIRPEGAFLYELASRNWFDAFNNTEARLAVLADQLAALVRGGAEAQAAAAKLGAQAPAKVARRWKPGPIAIGVMALVALAIVALTLVALDPEIGPARAATHGQRVAFFGFAAASNEPVASEIASTATDETFKMLNQIGLDTSSRAETRNVTLDSQITRAKTLGAQYILGGDVRSEGGRISVSMRMDDAVSRATIWEETLTGGASDSVSLPFQATAAATNVVSCYIRFRGSLKHEDDKTLKLVSRYCEATRGGDPMEVAERARELAAAAPDSALVHAYFAGSVYNILARSSLAARPALRQEMDAAVQRALSLDPGNARVRALLALQAISDGKPFAESEKTLLALLKDNPNDVTANNGYGNFLAAVGRYREAPPYHRAANRLEPFNLVLRTNLTLALARIGQTLEAATLFEETNTRLPTSANWSTWMNAALFYGVGDPAQVLKSAPAMVSGDTLACWRDISTAMRSRDRQARRASKDRMRQCLASGNIIGPDGFQLFASLGEVDAAFADTNNIDLTYSRLARLNPFFARSSRLVRADPRFLPLVKKTGQYQYWLDSGTRPDVCEAPEERDIEVCAALRKDQSLR